MATRLLMETHALLGVELRLRDLFDGPTVERMLEISVSAHVVRGADRPVLVVPAPADTRSARILRIRCVTIETPRDVSVLKSPPTIKRSGAHRSVASTTSSNWRRRFGGLSDGTSVCTLHASTSYGPTATVARTATRSCPCTADRWDSRTTSGSRSGHVDNTALPK